jgi:oxalate decarboxylase/phosphoglucose isomerase-like protein (cupin superfamily)
MKPDGASVENVLGEPVKVTPIDNYMFNLSSAPDSPIVGGIVHRANQASFPVLSGVACFTLTLQSGATRQPHLHTNASEISYIASGRARVGLVGPSGGQHLVEVGPGEIVFQPQGWPHWMENIGDGPLIGIFMYSHEQPVTIDLTVASEFYGVNKDHSA